MFKARFTGWDDVLAVDYTLSADYVAKASKQLGVTVILHRSTVHERPSDS